MTAEVRRAAVAGSIDALAQQWARQEDAPAGAAYVVDSEIAARHRGGVQWHEDDAIAVAVVARPTALGPNEVDLVWLAAGLGVADAIGRLVGRPQECVWPDALDHDAGCAVSISALTQLGPGRIDHAVLIGRVAPAAAIGARGELSAALVGELRRAAAILDEPTALVAAYRSRCTTLGRRVSVALLPHGSLRGTARDIGPDGGLVVESATGLRETIAVPMLGRLRVLDDSGG